MDTTPVSDTTARFWTLSDIAASQNVIKRTAQGWLAKAKAEYGDIGELVSGVRYFNIEERDILISYAAPPRVKHETHATAPPVPDGDDLEMTISTGNHCTPLDVPEFDGLTVDLGQFRDSEVFIVEDPLQAAERFLQAADRIQDALDNDIAAREQRLNRTKKARAMVAARAQELSLEQRLYRLQTSQLDGATTEETTALADAMEQMQGLGKPDTKIPPGAPEAMGQKQRRKRGNAAEPNTAT